MPESTVPASHQLTPAQRGIWYAQTLDPANPLFQLAQYAQIDGTLDVDVLGAAVDQVVAGTDALNMRFVDHGDGPVQVPSTNRARLQVTDLREAGHDAERLARQRMDEDLGRARDIGGEELLGFEVFRVAEERHLFYQRVHHLMLDGYSAVLVLQRISDLYSALQHGGAAAEAGPAFPPMSDLLAIEDDYEGSAAQEADSAHWQDHLDRVDGAPGLAGFPSGTARSIVRHAQALPAEQIARLERSGSVPATLLAATAVYLHKMTGERTVSLGVPVTARRGRTAMSVPSMTSNVVPVAVEIRPGARVHEVVADVGRALRSALIHQRFRLASVQRSPQPLGPSVNILPTVRGLHFGTATASLHILSTGPIDDLSLVFQGLADAPADDQDPRSGAEATLALEGNAELYDGAALQSHASRLVRLLKAMGETPQARISELEVTSGEERHELLDSGTAGNLVLPGGTVVDAFTASVGRTPDAVAVVARDGELTFGELDRAANRLAQYLRRFGAGPGALVAVHLERSTHLAVALLAVLKSGAAYVPVDPDYPPTRVDSMLNAAAPVLTLTSAELAARPGDPLPGHTVALDSPLVASVLDTKADTAPVQGPGPADLAYVVFTSGSTGTPKGVAVEHGSLANLFLAHRESLFRPAEQRLGRPLRVAHTAGISFDAAWDPMLWLFAGHQLQIVDNLIRRDPQALAALIKREGIDAIETTPSFVHALIEHGLLTDPVPDVIALGGEAVDADLWSTLAAHESVHAFNFYGPTETTVDSMTAAIGSSGSPQLGSPVANTRQYVLDSGLGQVPGGAIGELYLAGPNVARGYLGRPELSAERFIADPYGHPGERMYRTGDVVRRTADHGIEFLGRSDDQIKIRGFRVELPEIEAGLRAQTGVRGAAVIATRNAAGFDRLVAFATGQGLEGPALREALRRVLPEYMVPASIDILDSIPLTVNGKLDKSALPTPAERRAATSPRTDAERSVAAAFATVLDLADVGAEDDFFELGGHSLLATRLLADIIDRFGAGPTLRDIFAHPTVAGLAAELGSASAPGPALLAHPRPPTIPLSPGQRRLWFINRLDPADGSYTIPVVLRLSGTLDTQALGAAVNDVVERHEVLRTIYPADDAGPAQQVLPAGEVHVGLPRVQAGETAAQSAIAAETQRGFDLSREIPLRAALFGVGPESHLLLLSIHHIAADGWSMAPLAADLSAAYNYRTSGDGPSTPALELQYADYTLWQQSLLGDAEDPESLLASQLDFWVTELDGAPAQLSLPGARTGPGDDTTGDSAGTPGQAPVHLDAETTALLRAWGREHRASLFMVLQTGFAALLSRMGAGDDLPIGTPVAGRTEPGLEALVGFFVNTIVLRTNTSANPTAADLLDRVRETNLRAYAQQDAPFDRVVEAIRPDRIDGVNPLFQVMMTLQSGGAPTITMNGLDVDADRNPEAGGSKFDLLLDLAEDGATGNGTGDDGGVLTGGLTFDPQRIDARSARDLARRFELLIGTIAHNPDTALEDLPLMLDGEATTLQELGAGERITTGPATILEAFGATAAAHPERTAVSDADTSLDFAALSSRIDALAAGLAASGVHGGDRVASILPRSVDVPALALAVLRLGAVLVPVDSTYPAERIERILTDSAPTLVVGRADLNDAHPDHGATGQPSATGAPESCPRLDVETLLAAGATAPTGQWDAVDPDSPAYIVYTSGSTGTPKGVMVPHRALANLYTHHLATLFADTDPARATVGHIAGLGFDAAWDPMLWMVAGAQLLMVPDDVRANAEELSSLVAQRGITVLETTPSYARQLLLTGLAPTDPDEPLTLALGGEQIPQDLWDRLASDPQLIAHNLYGPTEFAVDSVTGRIRPGEVNIGHPAANLDARILDAALRQVPAGVVGELYLAGPGSANGYVNRPRETAASFVADPWIPGARMYRTGDLVRRNADGSLSFVDRADNQVKIRGFRVEPGEIERVITSCPGVVNATVLADPERGRITAYVVGSGDQESWRSHVARHLPSYMVPGAWVGLEDIPLTSHGKLDRSALPEPVAAAPAGRAPETDLERAVCTAFAAVLGVEDLPLDGNFFELGGHSLLAVSLVARLRADCGIDLPLRTLFEAPTPAGILNRSGATAPEQDDEASPADGTAMPRPLAWLASADNIPEQLPLSWAQRRMYFLNQLDPGNADYNISLAVRLTGDLDPGALEAALSDVVQRHGILRTLYFDEGAEPVQQVLAPSELGRILDQEHAGTAGKLRGALARGAGTGFDLRTEVPLRANLIETGPQTRVLHLVLHHIASDGASLQPLARDLSRAYAARRAGAGPEWTALPLQYADYARWQRAVEHDGEELTERLDAWATELAGVPDELELPTDGARSPDTRQPAAQLRFDIDAATATALGRRAAGQQASLFMSLHAVLGGFLARLGAGDDIVLGSPTAGRPDAELEEMVGFFVNTLPIHVDHTSRPTLDQAVSLARTAVLDAFDRDTVPFERLVEAVNPPRELGRHPLFQTMLTFEAAPPPALELPGLAADVVEDEGSGSAKFDLSFTFSLRADASLAVTLEYNSALFTRATIERITDQFTRFTIGAVEHPDTPLGDLTLMDPVQEASLQATTATAAPRTAAANRRGVLDVLDETIARHGAQTAVVAGDHTLDFAGLDAAAATTAGGLAASGVQRGDVVSLLLERTEHHPVAVVAALRLGAAVNPIDADYPDNRIADILADAAPAVVLASASLAARATAALHEAGTGPGTRLLLIEDLLADDGAAAAAPGAPTSSGPDSTDLAYVLFTSGSTGRPKGVEVSHGALANLLESHRTTLFPTPSATATGLRVAHTTGLGFDAAWDPFLWMVAGHELHLLGDGTRRDPQALAGYLDDEDIGVWETTPSHVRHLLDQPAFARLLDRRGSAGAPLRLALGGEAFDADLWDRLAGQESVMAHNLYGPTEATVDALIATVRSGSAPHLGRPVADTAAYVLDSRLRHVPPGATGELYLAGDGLARGYRGRAALTAERFIADPHGPAGTRMYRTGDLVTRHDDGTIIFRGRNDDQVKIRGQRVEPGEIARTLRSLDSVADAVVVADGAAPDQRLIGYVVPAGEVGDGRDFAASLHQETAARLPSYMVPAALLQVPRIPLTSHGKADLRQLPDPSTATHPAGRPPSTPREAALAAIFADVLDRDRVGVDESFFDLGGHSFLAQDLITRANHALGSELVVQTLFRAPTVEALVREAGSVAGDSVAASLQQLLPLRTSGTLDPLFAVHPASGVSWGYSALLRHLDSERPLYGLQMPGMGTEDPGPTTAVTLTELVDGYIGWMRTVQPHGPYHLMGWSFGGNVVQRLATRLQELGEEVDLLAILDAYPTGQDDNADVGEGGTGSLLANFLDAVGHEVPEDGQELTGERTLAVLRESGNPLGAVPTEALQVMIANFSRLAQLIRQAPLERFRGDLHFFTATEQVPEDRPDSSDWAPHVEGRIFDTQVPERHSRLLSERALGHIMPVLANHLAAGTE
ncbi:amino acid adenylation domain-containing protein [Arthrobacter rhombi]|uniref:amino acid adenylation domain-containing protein n=1 Tax=Arthrobacter rhombi TaxID=71253 RepID=UPI003FD5030F